MFPHCLWVPSGNAERCVPVFFKAPHGSDPCKVGSKTDFPARASSIASNMGPVFPAGPLETSRAFNWGSFPFASFSLLSFQRFPPPRSTGVRFGPRAESPGLLPQTGWGVGGGGGAGPALEPAAPPSWSASQPRGPSLSSRSCPLPPLDGRWGSHLNVK